MDLAAFGMFAFTAIIIIPILIASITIASAYILECIGDHKIRMQKINSESKEPQQITAQVIEVDK